MTHPVFSGPNGAHGPLVPFPVEKEVKNLDIGNAKVWTHLKFIIIQVPELLVCYFLVVMGILKIIEVVNRVLVNLWIARVFQLQINIILLLEDLLVL